VGYVTDTPYADTFFRELSPAWLNYVAALNGVAPRPIDAAFSYLELGCGFGTSTVVNAAAYPHASFHACDFIEEHIVAARGYADRLGVTNLTLHCDDFAGLRDAALPQFDFITLHGVYSWVDAQTRGILRELIAQLLLPGGLVYVSYNALPGWSHELPLRKLLVELADAEGDAARRSETAAATISRLSNAGLRYFTAHPAAKSAVDAYVRGDGHYLAHEFMNAAWEPFYAVDIADEFAGIGLEWVGSATLVDNHLPLILEAKAAHTIGSLPTRRQQQLVTDFAANQRFRRDVFVRPDFSSRDAEHLYNAVIGCAGDVERIGLTAPVPRGEIRFQEPFIRDVRTLMSARSLTFAAAIDALSAHGQDKSGIARNLLFLVASGTLAPFAQEVTPPDGVLSTIAGPVAERALREVATGGQGRRVVPSPAYGNGIEIDVGDAQAVLEWARQSNAPERVVPKQLATFARLRLVS
jgi:SAM-dependent methyltransferase